MTTKAAWHPKGIDPKARQAAEAAAKDAGIHVGQWVEAVIRHHTGNNPASDGPAFDDADTAKGGTLKQPIKKARRKDIPETPEDTGYPMPPPRPLRRQLRWLAAGSLVFLIFLTTAFGLFWIGEHNAPSSQMTGVERNAKKPGDISSASFQHIRDAAKIGDREAQFDLAMRYAAGEWVPKDELAAADWFEKAALQGHGEAQYRLGLFYEAGRGVSQNQFEAFFWFQSAAEQGHLQAVFKTADAYADGIGIGPDAEKAATLFGEAAERGHVEAMRRLADLYEQGKGLAKDLEAARLWNAAAEEVTAAEDAAARNTDASKDAQIVLLDKAPARAAPEAALTPEALEKIETLLADLGFAPGAVDGRITDETEAAIRLYQDFAGLPVDGQPSRALLEELHSISKTTGILTE